MPTKIIFQAKNSEEVILDGIGYTYSDDQRKVTDQGLPCGIRDAGAEAKAFLTEEFGAVVIICDETKAGGEISVDI